LKDRALSICTSLVILYVYIAYKIVAMATKGMDFMCNKILDIVSKGKMSFQKL